MQIETVTQDDNEFTFKLHGAGHTFCNALKDELTNDDAVSIATYSIKHPLVAEPKVFIETDGEDPVDALTDAVSRLQDRNDEFEEAYADLDTTA